MSVNFLGLDCGETIKTVCCLPAGPRGGKNLLADKTVCLLPVVQKKRAGLGSLVYRIPFYCDSGVLCTLNCASVLSSSERVKDKRKDGRNKHQVGICLLSHSPLSSSWKFSLTMFCVDSHCFGHWQHSLLCYWRALREEHTYVSSKPLHTLTWSCFVRSNGFLSSL